MAYFPTQAELADIHNAKCRNCLPTTPSFSNLNRELVEIAQDVESTYSKRLSGQYYPDDRIDCFVVVENIQTTKFTERKVRQFGDVLERCNVPDIAHASVRDIENLIKQLEMFNNTPDAEVKRLVQALRTSNLRDRLVEIRRLANRLQLLNVTPDPHVTHIIEILRNYVKGLRKESKKGLGVRLNSFFSRHFRRPEQGVPEETYFNAPPPRRPTYHGGRTTPGQPTGPGLFRRIDGGSRPPYHRAPRPSTARAPTARPPTSHLRVPRPLTACPLAARPTIVESRTLAHDLGRPTVISAIRDFPTAPEPVLTSAELARLKALRDLTQGREPVSAPVHDSIWAPVRTNSSGSHRPRPIMAPTREPTPSATRSSIWTPVCKRFPSPEPESESVDLEARNRMREDARARWLTMKAAEAEAADNVLNEWPLRNYG